MLEGLPRLPPAQIEYRGKRLAEFDLDGALARQPGLILVDELAHSNVAGSRHPKRWQDVEELLAAGIDVYSTLNVQHLESLNDVVGGITGIVVHETLPDTFFDRADEVVLVDTPADELIERLAAGKVYMPAQAERAAKNFFRKGNLMALRELALRRTADRVEDDVLAYRVDRSIAKVWKTEGALLCCIGPHKDAGHVVRSAAQLAQAVGGDLACRVRRDTGPAAPGLWRDARASCRPSSWRRSWAPAPRCCRRSRIAEALVAHARPHNLSKLVLGTATMAWCHAARAASAERGRGLAPDIDRIEVGRPQRRGRPQAAGGDPDADGRRRRDRRSAQVRRVAAMAVCGGTTVLLAPAW